MLTRLIGDIHGNFYDYQLLTQPIEHNSIQVGDFGIGFGQGDYWNEKVNDHQRSGQHRFIRGNHDSPELCRTEMVGWIPDGTVENDVMFIGGAWSIDHQWRTDGIDWWRDEECSYSQLNQFIDTYAIMRPRVVISHDCPTLTAYNMFVKHGQSIGGKSLHLTRTGEAFQTMFETHQPEEWYFGHWHQTKTFTMEGTKFQCLGIDDFVDVEL